MLTELTEKAAEYTVATRHKLNGTRINMQSATLPEDTYSRKTGGLGAHLSSLAGSRS